MEIIIVIAGIIILVQANEIKKITRYSSDTRN